MVCNMRRICYLLLFAHVYGPICMHNLRVCEQERNACVTTLEKVPPAEWRRIADELAECQQHLEDRIHEDTFKTV